MTGGAFRFGDFTVSPSERQLTRGMERLELSSRYLDALTLLVRERGRLITKERFLEEIWGGVPVTDEALTQCIRTLRRQLGDDAARPRFIETVPKHGYRFIADVHWEAAKERSSTRPSIGWRAVGRASKYCAVGGAIAGVGGGLLYGLAATPASSSSGLGATSILLVMLALNVLVGLAAGLGVGTGIVAFARLQVDKWQVSTFGGMVGGLLTGGIIKLLGLDAFSLLFGRSPESMTGPAEGALLGAALGFAAWIAKDRALSVKKSAIIGGVAGAGAGFLTPLLGGHLLGGSLNLLTKEFPDARFRLDSIGTVMGENGFGRLSELTTTTIEGGLFGLGVAGALAIASRQRRNPDPS